MKERKDKKAAYVALGMIIVLAVAGSGYYYLNPDTTFESPQAPTMETQVTQAPTITTTSRTWVNNQIQISGQEVVEQFLDGGVWYTVAYSLDYPVNFAAYGKDACERWKETGKFQTSLASTGESGYQNEFSARYVTEQGRDETHCFVFKVKDNGNARGSFTVEETQRI